MTWSIGWHALDNAAFWSADELHAAPTAVLQLETQVIPGISNHRAVLRCLPYQSYILLFLPLHWRRWSTLLYFQELERYGSHCLSSILPGWKKGPLQVRDPPPSVHWIAGAVLLCAWRTWAALERCVWGRVMGWVVPLFPDSRWEADVFLPQTTSIRKKLLGMHKGRDLTLERLLVNL